MKKLKQLTLVLNLVLVLASSAFGGIISTPAPPPPAAPSAVMPGDIWIPGHLHVGAATESAVIGALILLQNALFGF